MFSHDTINVSIGANHGPRSFYCVRATMPVRVFNALLAWCCENEAVDKMYTDLESTLCINLKQDVYDALDETLLDGINHFRETGHWGEHGVLVHWWHVNVLPMDENVHHF